MLMYFMYSGCLCFFTSTKHNAHPYPVLYTQMSHTFNVFFEENCGQEVLTIFYNLPYIHQTFLPPKVYTIILWYPFPMF